MKFVLYGFFGTPFQLLFLGIILNMAPGCSPSAARPAAYGFELEECNRTSNTLEESIACENNVRARYGRPLRVIPVRPHFNPLNPQPSLPTPPADAGADSPPTSQLDAGTE